MFPRQTAWMLRKPLTTANVCTDSPGSAPAKSLRGPNRTSDLHQQLSRLAIVLGVLAAREHWRQSALSGQERAPGPARHRSKRATGDE
jgi:hypothetical protein